jgi:hypothetical protein
VRALRRERVQRLGHLGVALEVLKLERGQQDTEHGLSRMRHGSRRTREMPGSSDFSLDSIQARNGQILLTFIAIAACVISVSLRQLVLQRRRSFGSSSTAPSFS